MTQQLQFRQVDLPRFNLAEFLAADRAATAAKLKMQAALIDDDDEDDAECPACQGTGEGQHEGQSCTCCHGQGY